MADNREDEQRESRTDRAFRTVFDRPPEWAGEQLGTRRNFSLPRGSRGALAAEMIAFFGIVAVRAVADYRQKSSGTKPGTEAPSKGAPPIALLAAGLITFFALALLAAAGRQASRVAAAFGLLVVLALTVNSVDELDSVAGWLEGPGKGTLA